MALLPWYVGAEYEARVTRALEFFTSGEGGVQPEGYPSHSLLPLPLFGKSPCFSSVKGSDYMTSIAIATQKSTPLVGQPKNEELPLLLLWFAHYDSSLLYLPRRIDGVASPLDKRAAAVLALSS